VHKIKINVNNGRKALGLDVGVPFVGGVRRFHAAQHEMPGKHSTVHKKTVAVPFPQRGKLSLKTTAQVKKRFYNVLDNRRFVKVKSSLDYLRLPKTRVLQVLKL